MALTPKVSLDAQKYRGFVEVWGETDEAPEPEPSPMLAFLRGLPCLSGMGHVDASELGHRDGRAAMDVKSPRRFDTFI